jgi:hypothetical protein
MNHTPSPNSSASNVSFLFQDSTINESNHLLFDLSGTNIVPHHFPIISDISNNIENGIGYAITTNQGITTDGSTVTQTTFVSTEPELYDPIITENLVQEVETYNDETGQTQVLLDQIKTYAAQINCADFHGKGSIDDYTVLFEAASKIAVDSKQMELDIDVDGFADFGQAADELSVLFTSFIVKLQNVNIITDITFLTAISSALGKIVNLSKVFGKFKETILTTTTIQFPKSAHDTSLILRDVMDEVNCAMGFIQHFVSPSDVPLNGADLSDAEKNIINQSVHTIDSWNVLCEQGVSIAMANNGDVQYIQQASNQLKNTTNSLRSATSTLRIKLARLIT